VVSTLFLPGQEIVGSRRSRSEGVLDRILALSEAEVGRQLAATLDSFVSRHRDLVTLLDERFLLVEHRLSDPGSLSLERRRLVGAYFSQEYAFEAAALFNPSMVAHPDQTGLPDGSTRFVMSVRGVGEGHISSIGFRTGTIDAQDVVALDDLGTTTVHPARVPATYSRAVFAHQTAELGGDQSSARFLLESLPAQFVRTDLDLALSRLRDQRLTRVSAVATTETFERIAACNYAITFPADSAIHERVIMPGGPSESHGVEDLRLVRFTEPDGSVDYRGTYTAFDGSHVVPQLLRTVDFRTFHISQLDGPAAKDKGMALFPRRVADRYLALSRWDREDNSLAASDDAVGWDPLTTIQSPQEAWELIQLGNCGPPIETDAGWLVLTHGVGPMREYGMGAILLDLDDPTRVLGRLSRPLLAPRADERNGYVPNVVYSCGGLVHQDTLVLPYGASDAVIRIALVDLGALLAELLDPPTAT
jgi:predicted GH43/DUF377 family glycosyl hydrolase